MSPPASPNDLTRHQLDELDALLQRMLSLPLGGTSPGATPDDRPAALTMPDLPAMPPTPAGGTWRNDAAPTHRLPYSPSQVPAVGDANTPSWGHDAPRSTPANFHVPTLAMLPPPSVEVIPDTIPLFGPPTGEARTLRGVDVPPVVPADEVVLVAVPKDKGTPVADRGTPVAYASGSPAHASAAMFAPAGATPDADPVPLAVWPLYAVNSVVETGLDQCGPLGRLVTNRASKQLLGWSGVALLALAGVWLARGYGLIDFPLPTGGAVASALGR